MHLVVCFDCLFSSVCLVVGWVVCCFIVVFAVLVCCLGCFCGVV